MEEGMLINAVTSFLYNGDMVQKSGRYYVSIYNEIEVVLVPLKEEDGNFLADGNPIIIEHDSPYKSVVKWDFEAFLKQVFVVDSDRKRMGELSKEERLSELFRGITDEDIMEYFKSRKEKESGKSD